jgi:hypothetical protein
VSTRLNSASILAGFFGGNHTNHQTNGLAANSFQLISRVPKGLFARRSCDDIRSRGIQSRENGFSMPESNCSLFWLRAPLHVRIAYSAHSLKADLPKSSMSAESPKAIIPLKQTARWGGTCLMSKRTIAGNKKSSKVQPCEQDR